MNSGYLLVRTTFAAGKITIRDITLSRPSLSALLTGMNAEQAQTAIPLLYSLCREAQSAAASAALARAQDKTPPVPDAGKLWREMLHERLWRLCLDWPRLLNCPDAEISAARQGFSAWRIHCQKINDARADSVRDFSDATRQLLAKLADILPNTPNIYCALLRQEAEDILGAWRRQRFYPFFSVSFAMRQEQQRRQRQGRSAILTARGWLLHETTLDADGKIASYIINAPTDRHFTNSCTLAKQLAIQVTESTPQNQGEAQNALECALLKLDPCVPWEIIWES